MNRKIINLLFCIFTFFLFSLNCYAHDYDITTSAPPDAIMDIFKDFWCIETGIQHGTVSIVIEKDIYEITEILKKLENGKKYQTILSKKEETIEDKSLNQLNEISNLYNQGELIQWMKLKS